MMTKRFSDHILRRHAQAPKLTANHRATKRNQMIETNNRRLN